MLAYVSVPEQRSASAGRGESRAHWARAPLLVIPHSVEDSSRVDTRTRIGALASRHGHSIGQPWESFSSTLFFVGLRGKEGLREEIRSGRRDLTEVRSRLLLLTSTPFLLSRLPYLSLHPFSFSSPTSRLNTQHTQHVHSPSAFYASAHGRHPRHPAEIHGYLVCDPSCGCCSVVGGGAVVDGGFPRGRLLREGGRASRNRGLSSGAKNDNYFSSYAMTAATGSDRFSNAGRAGGIPFCWRGINCLSRLALVLRLCRRWGQDANPS